MADVRALPWLLLSTACVMAAPPAQAEDEARKEPALQRQASITLSVEDASAASKEIAGLVVKLGGRVVVDRDRELALDVPTPRYRDFVQRLSSIGELLSERAETVDVSNQIADAAAEERSAEQRRARLARLDDIARGIPEHIIVMRERQQATEAVTRAQKHQRDMESRALVTRVSLAFSTTPVEHVGETSLPFPWLGDLGLPKLLDTSDSGRPPSRDLRAIVDGALGLRGGWARSKERYGTKGTLALAMNMRVLGEAQPVGVFGGFDLALGGGGGFLYGLQTVLGAGVPIGDDFAFALGTGPGVDGITSTVPIGVTLPIELYLTWDFSTFMGANAWVRDGWVFAADERKKGSTNAPFGDELSAGISFAFGAREGSSYTRNRFGPRLGVGYREMLGTRVYELTLAFGAREADYSEAY